MISKHPERIIIVTYDLKLNRTFTTRYFSFIKALKSRGHEVRGVGIDFTFNPHPINNLDKTSHRLDVEEDIITLRPKKLNFVQKLLTFSDSINFPFFLKKYLLALHIIVYKKDQWVVDLDDFEVLDDFKPTVVIAGGTGGTIETAYKLAKKYEAKLILDYRDPWNFGYHLLETNQLANRFKRKFTLKHELHFLAEANHIITVSDSLKSFFPTEIQPKVTVIENGSNFEQTNINGAQSKKHPKYFNIVYLGTVYNEQLADQSFFKALKTLIEQNNIEETRLKLQFIGASKNTLLPSVIAQFNFGHFTTITRRLPASELTEVLTNASMFLHLKYGNRDKIITSKQADYLMFRKPILLPHTDNGDIAESIINYEAGYVCDGKQQSIIKALQTEYDKFLKGESNILKERDFSFLSRSKIAEKLFEIIH